MKNRAVSLFLCVVMVVVAFAALQAGLVRADAVAQTLPFAQDWSDTNLVTADDDWSGVPGITGYLGQDITKIEGTNPQSLLSESASANDQTVLANRTATNITNGDVAEFELANPAIALQGSGTADAPYILISIRTGGYKDIHVSYNLRDLDLGDNAIQPVALQYRIGNSGLFTNVAAGFVADATTGPNQATLVTPVSVTLPAEADEQALVQIRIITTNAASADEWVGIDDISITGTSTGVDSAPSVSSTTPADLASDVAHNSNLSINFSEPVNVRGEWFAIVCSTSGTRTVADTTVTGGPGNFTIDPTTDFAYAESCTLSIFAGQVTDTDANDPPDNPTLDYQASFDIIADLCALPYTPIYDIQGSGPTAAVTGVVTTQGVVIGDYEVPAGSGQMRGYYLQAAAGDGNPATSDGIFVYSAGVDTVSLGDVVRLTGTVGEYQGQTQISDLTFHTLCGTGTVAPADVSLPWGSADQPERYEGMLIRLPQTLYVTEHFQLGRFGQIVVSSNARLYQPTQLVAPGPAAQSLQTQNDLNRLILDDGSNTPNPDPILFGRSGLPLSAGNTLRAGDSLTDVVGVLTYTWGGDADSPNAYRLRPVNALGGALPNIVTQNPRPAAPASVGGSIRVAGMNVLNYFNTFGAGNCTNGLAGPATDCRGANNTTEFTRQSDKIVRAILALDADVIGIVEMENDGYAPASAIQDLVNKLNSTTAPGTYAFINADTATGLTNALGSEAIKVGILYKPARVKPLGTTAILNTTAFLTGGDSTTRNRASLLQAFQTVTTSETFLVNVNHLKSKGSACDTPNSGDGQGECAQVRANAATALIAWLASNPTGTNDPDILILGDLNSYAKETPIAAFEAAGYTNLTRQYGSDLIYSYGFDGQWGSLDHALASASLLGQATGATEFHINADEPSVLDYNTEFKSAGQLTDLYASDPFRAADHDPILVGLNLEGNAPTITAPANTTVEAVSASGAIVTFSASASDTVDPNPTLSCLPASGSTFPLGITSVTCSASDKAGNTSQKSFTVNVVDTTHPTLHLPDPITRIADSSEGMIVNYTASASDLVDASPTLSCSPASGSLFPPGRMTVTCTSTDDANNTATGRFLVAITSDKNLVNRPGFEGPYTLPYPWIPFGIYRPYPNALSCGPENCSVQLNGTPTNISQVVVQIIPRPGSAGGQFAFGIFSRAQDVPAESVYKFEIIFANPKEQKLEKKTLTLAPGTHDFEMYTGTITVPIDYTHIILRFIYRNPNGSVWFDNAFLHQVP